MDDLIKIKGGSGKTPTLQDKELGYNRDEKALYIGTPSGNERLCGAGDTDVFYATFGETAGEAINAAYQAGKLVACKLENGRVLYLVNNLGTGKSFTFSSTDDLIVVSAKVDGSTWTEPTYQEFATKEFVNGLVTEIEKRLTALETKEGEANG